LVISATDNVRDNEAEICNTIVLPLLIELVMRRELELAMRQKNLGPFRERVVGAVRGRWMCWVSTPNGLAMQDY
jgi:hypothetical protein